MSFCSDSVLSTVIKEVMDGESNNLCLCVHSSTKRTEDDILENLNLNLNHSPVCFKTFKDKENTIFQYDSRVHQVHQNCLFFEEPEPQLRRQLSQSDSPTFFSQNGNVGTIENQNQNGNQVANAVGNSNVNQSNEQTQNQDSPSVTFDSTVEESRSPRRGFLPNLLGGRLFSLSSCALDNSCTQFSNRLIQAPSPEIFEREPDWSVLDWGDP